MFDHYRHTRRRWATRKACRADLQQVTKQVSSPGLAAAADRGPHRQGRMRVNGRRREGRRLRSPVGKFRPGPHVRRRPVLHPAPAYPGDCRCDGSSGDSQVYRCLAGPTRAQGIFLTTSAFTSDARDYVSMIDSKIILIDGKRLAEFMIDHGVGVTPLASYEVKRVDTDYFVEE